MSASETQATMADDEQTRTLDRQLHGLPSHDDDKNNSLVTYATTTDVFWVLTSSLAAVIAGALNPLLTVIYGQFAGVFTALSHDSVDTSRASSSSETFTLYFVYLAISSFVFTYCSTVGFYYVGERLTRRLRLAYFRSILRQNMAFFDTTGSGMLTTRLTTDMGLIQEGITGKLSLCLTSAATFGSAFIIGYVIYWKLALILSSTIVAMTVCSTVCGTVAVTATKRSLDSATQGATVAEEAITSIRHVTAFGIQNQLAERYRPHLLSAKVQGQKGRSAVAAVVAVLNSVPYMSYALSFWMGSRYLVDGVMGVSDITTITLAIVIGAWSVGRVAPNAQGLISCVASAKGILDAIARRSPQDPFATEGIDASFIDGGSVEFANVSLVYPSRRDVSVLKDLSFIAPAGKTTAVVGVSGSGKSSIMDLLMRFYEPTAGAISFAGHETRSLNLRSLRRQIALVGQEPRLFNTTIFENIAHGLAGLDTKQSPQHIEQIEQRVIQAAKNSNVHDFIIGLPLGYRTLVGEKGLQLSGGQRQRICIARALIGDPKLLLLDEATSALDVKSELTVQRALEVATQGRSTIIIAHRLSTIKNADKIVVVSLGRVVEQGIHEELLAMRGHYFDLVKNQELKAMGGDRGQDEKAADHERDEVQSSNKSQWNVAEATSSAVGAEKPVYGATTGDRSPSDRAVPALSFLETQRLLASIALSGLPPLALGLVLSVISGLGTPAQSVIFAKLINSLALPATSYPTLLDRVDFYSLIYFVIGVAILLIWIAQGVVLGYCEENAVFAAKEHTFRSLLRQEVLFFDRSDHSTSHLMSLLSRSTTDLGGVGGLVLGSILSFVGTIGGGLILSLAIGWKLALVCAATIPIVAGSGYLRLKMLSMHDQEMKLSQREADNYASEMINAVRTVASLSLEETALQRYDNMLAEQARKSLASILRTSIVYAVSQSVTFLCASLAFWYGGTLIIKQEYSVFQFFVCFACLISGAQTAGIIFTHAPGFSKAMIAAGDLKDLFDRNPEIDTWRRADLTDDVATNARHEKMPDSRIVLNDVSFHYPERPDHTVLRNFSLTIHSGQFIALVGPSGCGKSTIIGLLERFFDPTSGHVSYGGQSIAKLDVNDWRRRLSYVGQETSLYTGTIRDNLILGAPDGVRDEHIVAACMEANIYDFISSLPDGFSTHVGAHGNMLSGGQRQRLAIARALLRDTEILLLDEATSSLDSESEKLVQQALKVAMRRRTTIAVAHRLSTVQDADCIFVMEEGMLREYGSHEDLLSKKGRYWSMVQTQGLESDDPARSNE